MHIKLMMTATALLITGCASDTGQDGAPSSRLTDRFNSMDSNNDGLISPDEAPSRINFEDADTNGDGQLTLEEVQAYTSNMRG